jgi:hypothetical protein
MKVASDDPDTKLLSGTEQYNGKPVRSEVFTLLVAIFR